MKYKILFTSKNNYDLLENWIKKYSSINLPGIINLDIGSNKGQYIFGKKICEKYNITFLEAERTEFQENIKQTFIHLSSLNVDYLLYLHQDCFPVEVDTFDKINHLINSYQISDFGCIGFNVYHDIEIKKLDKSNLIPMTTSRCILQKGNGYYMRYPKGSKVNYKKFIKGKPFKVENVMWTALLLSQKSFFKNIKIDRRFNFFLSPDDMAYQFLSKGIKNIVFPNIHFVHDQAVKTKYNLPKDSPLGKAKEVEARYGKFIGIEDLWIEKWGFIFNPKKNINLFNNRYLKFICLRLFPRFYSSLETVGRQTYKNSNSKNKFFDEFYNHNPESGPLKYISLRNEI